MARAGIIKNIKTPDRFVKIRLGGTYPDQPDPTGVNDNSVYPIGPPEPVDPRERDARV